MIVKTRKWNQLGSVINTLLSSLTPKGLLYSRGGEDKVRTVEQKKKKYTYRCLPPLAIHLYTWLAQFVNLLSQRGSSSLGSVPAPTRFSEAHAAPDIAGIMEQAESTNGYAEERHAPTNSLAGENPRWEPVFPTCSQNMIGTRPHLLEFMRSDFYVCIPRYHVWMLLFSQTLEWTKYSKLPRVAIFSTWHQINTFFFIKQTAIVN